jgi:FKBP-type peptidyl-prolyl cis-trans isomerase SlyD
MSTIRDDMVVSMDYTLRLEDGEVVDSSQGREPLQFIQGRGDIISGLEKQLYDLSLGDEKQVVVPPGEAYGEFDDELLQEIPRSAFPADMVLEKGMGFRMRTDTGQVVTVYIDHTEGDSVVVDMNHPLAGETLHFDVKIVGLREATAEELQGGCSSCAGCSTCGDGECDGEDEEESCCGQGGCGSCR